jgi:hypothetical protein
MRNIDHYNSYDTLKTYITDQRNDVYSNVTKFIEFYTEKKFNSVYKEINNLSRIKHFNAAEQVMYLDSFFNSMVNDKNPSGRLARAHSVAEASVKNYKYTVKTYPADTAKLALKRKEINKNAQSKLASFKTNHKMYIENFENKRGWFTYNDVLKADKATCLARGYDAVQTYVYIEQKLLNSHNVAKGERLDEAEAKATIAAHNALDTDDAKWLLQ